MNGYSVWNLERVVGKSIVSYVFEQDLQKVQQYRLKGLKEGPQYFNFRIVNHRWRPYQY